MLKAIIIDDELPGRMNAAAMLRDHCRHIQVCGSFGSGEEARQFLIANEINVIFLDILMPGENGFQFLATIDPQAGYQVVFITAHNEYALRAIKASAVDYLLKPFSIAELLETEQRLMQLSQHDSRQRHSAVSVFLENQQFNRPQKLSIHHSKGFNVISVSKIIRVEADGNYSTVFMEGSAPLLTTWSIKEFEDILDPQFFLRVHRSHLVNLHYMEQYLQDDTGYVILTGGHKVEVSRRRMPVLIEKLTGYAKPMKR